MNTSEHLSIKVALAKRLAKNSIGYVASPTSWSAFDGANDVRSTSSSSSGRFTFNTDANGNISQYQGSISLQQKGSAVIIINSDSADYSRRGDNVTDGLCRGGRNNASEANNSFDGTWRRR